MRTGAAAGHDGCFHEPLPTTDSATAGLGLWMAHQICREVTLHRHGAGFTVRLVA